MADVPAAGPGPRARTSHKRPADLTGMRKQELEKEHAAELEESSKRMALVNAQKVQLLDEVHSAGDIRVNEPTTTIRVNYPIEDMTFGREVFQAGDEDNPMGGLDSTEPYVGALRQWTFEEGQKYTVPTELAEHLDAKGYLWH